jgi:hypothetical protein
VSPDAVLLGAAGSRRRRSPEGGYGLGTLFAFPLQSVEVVAPLPDSTVLVASENTYPAATVGSPARLKTPS